ncbi:MAG: (2Fe-2S) ferredoxin domain-containing protein [Lachnospiraceae bacterium]
MKITICIGSSCHLKGSKDVVEGLQQLIKANDLSDQIELSGAFCMGNCVNGVSVKIDEELFNVQPSTTKSFFEQEVLTRL